MNRNLSSLFCAFCCVLLGIVPCKGESLDILPFGSVRLYSDGAGPLGDECDLLNFERLCSADSINALGVFWWEPRDIQSVVVVYPHPVSRDFAESIQIQYWHSSWPEPPPEMPAVEDQEDDLWRGEWITASTNIDIAGGQVTYSFRPLQKDENRNAACMPVPVIYRRTLKIRLQSPGRPLAIKDLRIYSMTKVKSESIRIEMNRSGRDTSKVNASVALFNGRLEKLRGWGWQKNDFMVSDSSFCLRLNGRAKGIIADIKATDELLTGSNEESIVTVRTSKYAFSFLVNDLKTGPISIPAYDIYIARASDQADSVSGSLPHGKSTRQKILGEYEQDYDRARKEIPELDPTRRDPRHALQNMYMPLAADASWQKFAIIWGGNVLIDKRRSKAKGKEYARCNWRGEELRWEIGTGLAPIFSRTRDNCQLTVLHDYLPVVINRWRNEGLIFEQEAFATLLSGPLSPSDPLRSEQTPAILMMKLTIANPSPEPKKAHLWLAGNEALRGIYTDDSFLMEAVENKNIIRCYFSSPVAAGSEVLSMKSGNAAKNALHQTISIEANEAAIIYLYFPFVGDLTAQFQPAIRALSYENEKEKIISYWRDQVQRHCAFNVPEAEFNQIAKAIIPHIRMSVTKDPKSGLYMVPAGTLGYGVYANESCFQTMLLDRLGDHDTVSDYLKAFAELQGSVPLAGDFSGDQKDVFYGVKVDSIYDLTAAPYNLDHGTVLWAFARHYLYSRDQEWLGQAAPHMRRAANWIIEQRQRTKSNDGRGNKVSHYGLMPAGRLEDAAEWQYWYAVNAYAYLGLESTAKAFEQAGMAGADYYGQQAREYLADIRSSVQKAMEMAPVVQSRNHQYMPYIPAQAHQRLRSFGPKKTRFYDRYQRNIQPTLRQSATREVLYGPIILLKTGIIDPMDPMAEWILDDWEDNLTLSSSLNLNVHGWVDDEYWFSRGGMVFQPNLQNPVEIYLKRHEIPAALRSLYNGFVSCLYPDANTLAEEYRCWSRASGHYYKVPDEARFVNQVLDLLVLETKHELWLASGTPRRWLEPGQEIELRGIANQYGELSYSMHPGKKAKTIEAEIDMKLNSHPDKILLFVRAPYGDPIHEVKINGQVWEKWDSEQEVVFLPQESGLYSVQVNYN
jgi:hypothetical protein